MNCDHQFGLSRTLLLSFVASIGGCSCFYVEEAGSGERLVVEVVRSGERHLTEFRITRVEWKGRSYTV